MSGVNSTGGGISFNGPIQLSGLALSKKYLLKTQDNYVQFMSDMLNLFKEDINVFQTATEANAENSKKELMSGAFGELTGGIVSCAAAFATVGMTMSDAKESQPDRDASSKLGKDADNLEEINSGLMETRRTTTLPEGADGDGDELQVGAEGEQRSPEEIVERLANRGNIKVGDENISMKDLAEEKASGGDTKYKKVKDAVEAMQKKRMRLANEGGHDDEVANIDRQLDSLHAGFKDEIKYTRMEKDQRSNDANQKTTKSSAKIQLVNTLSQGASSVARAGGTMAQAKYKEASTYAQSTSQMNQQVLSTTEGAAQKAAQHADDIVQLERQIQANNIARG